MLALIGGVGLWAVALGFGLYVVAKREVAPELNRGGKPGAAAARAKLSVDRRAMLAEVQRQAAAGEVLAMRELAAWHARGEPGVLTRDPAQAFAWEMKAAQAGSIDAMVVVGRWYREGFGTARSTTRALEWYQRAAATGSAEAGRELGDLYFKGEDVPTDFAAAYRWYQLGADGGDLVSLRHVAYMLETGCGRPRDFRAAYYVYARLAESGDAWAQNKAGWLLASGLGGPKDETAAARWFRAAAENDYPIAMANFGVALMFGRGVEQDEAEGRRWLQRAVDAGEPFAMVQLGDRYLHGQGGYPKDVAKAVALFRRAAERHDEDAQCLLAELQMRGEGMPKDLVQARLEFEALAFRGNAPAKADLAEFYAVGAAGAPANLAKARKLLQEAADAGVESAKKRLEEIPRSDLSASELAAVNRAIDEFQSDFGGNIRLDGTPEVLRPGSKLTVVVPPKAKTPEELNAEAAAAARSIPRADHEETSKADVLPVPLSRGQPEYPLALRVLNLTGWVVVDFVVDAEGNAIDVHTVKSSAAGFEASAVAAVSKWRFKPGLKAGRPVRVHMRVPIIFNLTDDVPTPAAPPAEARSTQQPQNHRRE